MIERTYEGRCLCGLVAVVAQGAPKRMGMCHCITCRRNTAAAFWPFAVFDRDRVTIAGQTKSILAPRIPRHFCPECGSLIYLADKEGEIDISLGILDDGGALAPQYQTWTTRRWPWLPDFPEQKGFEHSWEPAAGS